MWGKKEPESNSLSREELFAETEELKQEILRQEIKKQKREVSDRWFIWILSVVILVGILALFIYTVIKIKNR